MELLRWVPDVPLCETSPATTNKEKQMFSQANTFLTTTTDSDKQWHIYSNLIQINADCVGLVP